MGGSSKHSALVRRLAASLPALLAGGRRVAVKAVRERQVQRRLTAEQVDQLLSEYRAGASMKDLADQWRLHRTTVAGHLRQAGVALRRQGLSDAQLSEAVRLYGEGWSCQRLADRYNCDDETVRTYLRRAGVRMRWPWERH